MKINRCFSLLFWIYCLIIYPTSTLSYNICIDPGHGWDSSGNLNGWENSGPIFNVNGKKYVTLKQPKNYNENPTALSNTIEMPENEWPNWLLLEKRIGPNKVPVGLLEYQNNWKIAGYLKQILENRHHTVHLTKSEHANPTFEERAQVAFDNSCDFIISIHTNAPGNGTTALGLFYAKSEFRVDYYRGTPPQTPVPTPPDTNPAQ